MKKVILIAALIMPLIYTGCKEDPDEPLDASVEIGTQVWTSANHSVNGKELFTYEEAKLLTPPEGFRAPDKNDWGKLLTFLGHKNGFSSGIVHWSPQLTITSQTMEGDFEVIKSLLANVQWGSVTGTNVTGFNLVPSASGVSGVHVFCTDPKFAFVELSDAGYYLESFNIDPRQQFPNTYPEKYLVRFVKDK